MRGLPADSAPRSNCRLGITDGNRDVALKSMGKKVMRFATGRLSDIPVLCAFAVALLGQAAFLSRNAVAGSGEVEQVQSVQSQPRLRLAQNSGPARKAGAEPKLSADAEADG